MIRDDVIAKLNQHRSEFEALGVDHLCLFGSVARGEISPSSDVDLVATFHSEARPGLKIVRLHRRLEEVLGCSVDLLRAPIRRPELKQIIDQEGIYAF